MNKSRLQHPKYHVLSKTWAPIDSVKLSTPLQSILRRKLKWPWDKFDPKWIYIVSIITLMILRDGEYMIWDPTDHFGSDPKKFTNRPELKIL